MFIHITIDMAMQKSRKLFSFVLCSYVSGYNHIYVLIYITRMLTFKVK